jgi:spore germination cell wall hydrolase CwlJ-like protein
LKGAVVRGRFVLVAQDTRSLSFPVWTRAAACARGGGLLAIACLGSTLAQGAVMPNRSRDIDCLAQAVYYEARGEGLDGQAAVAQVVLNRSRIASFPGTVCGVVYQGKQSGSCQFSFVCNGAMRWSRDEQAWVRARFVAVRALDGYVMEKVKDATSFHALPERGRRSRRRQAVRVGGHVFVCGGRSQS